MVDQNSDVNNSEKQSHDADTTGSVGEDTTVILQDGVLEPPSKKPSSRALGTTIGGHYRLESRIGSGGSSAVYLATDLSLNRKVAVKLLLSGAHFADEEKIRFQREGRAVGSLDHPHIVRIFEFNTTENDEPFLVMEYLQGRSLQDIIKERGTIPMEEFLPWASQVVQALAYAHKRGIVHRDVKSSNIVIVQNIDGVNIAKVVDFGLARPDEEGGENSKGLTITGTIFGSPHYMSPEQCRGEHVDARSDIYSLGCVMYECINGHVPFTGASMMETFRMHLEEQPKPFAAKLKNIQNAADIEKIVFKCLAKNPADRYQDADRLEQDLKALEKNARSSIGSSAASKLRVVRAGLSAVLSKHGKILGAVLTVLAAFVCILLFRPQAMTELFDKHWSSVDFKAQQSFDAGDYAAAENQYKECLDFLEYAPVTKKELRRKDGVLGLLDLATLQGDEEKIAIWTKKLQEIRKIVPNVEGTHFESSMPGLLEQLKELKNSTSSQDQKTKIAANILNRASDAAEVMIEDGRSIDAGEFLEAAYLGTNDYIPDSDSVVPRALLNLVAIKINTDPVSSFKYLVRCHSLMEEQKKTQQPFARARFLSDLGRYYLLAMHPEQAEGPLSEALEIYRLNNWVTGPGAGNTYLRLADAQIRLGQPREASSSLEQAEIAFNSGGEAATPSNLLHCDLTRAEILVKTGRVKQGLDLVSEQLLKEEKAFPKRNMDLAETLFWNTRLLLFLPYSPANEQKAKFIGSRVCAMWERMEEYSFAGSIWMSMGKYEGDSTRLVEAERCLTRAAQDFSKMKTQDYFSTLSLYANLGEVYMRRSQDQKAYEALKLGEMAYQKTKHGHIASIIGVSTDSVRFLYARMAQVTEKLGLREENKKCTDILDSTF